jgi:hypothetical protein
MSYFMTKLEQSCFMVQGVKLNNAQDPVGNIKIDDSAII